MTFFFNQNLNKLIKKIFTDTYLNPNKIEELKGELMNKEHEEEEATT